MSYRFHLESQYSTVSPDTIWCVERRHLYFSNLFKKEKSTYGSKVNLTLDCTVVDLSIAMAITLHCGKERKTQKILLLNYK